VAEENQPVTLEVKVEANPTPEIRWNFAGNPVDLEGDERFTLMPGN